MNRFFRGICLLLAVSMLVTLVSCNNGTSKITSSTITTKAQGDNRKILTNEEYASLIKKLSVPPEPAPVDMYKLTGDKCLIYNPLSREAEKVGTLNKYDNADMNSGTITLNGVNVTYKIPKKATPYDVIPIKYTLKATDTSNYPIYIEATAFEDEAKRKGRDLYDMSIPDKLDIKWEYKGYVAGTYKGVGDRNKLSADFTDTPAKAYPNYTTTPLTKSGTIPTCDIFWLKFKFTNTGNTIIDPEGNGAILFWPKLMQRDSNGMYKVQKGIYNYYARIYDYIYPGESGEIWFCFGPSDVNWNTNYNLEAGDYRVSLETYYRHESGSPNWLQNMWDGALMAQSIFDFTAAPNAKASQPDDVITVYKTNSAEKNAWLAKFEEFMTSFDALKSSSRTEETGTVYLQCAPWTTQVVLKLIDKAGIKTVAIPITMDNDAIKVKFNPDNNNFAIVDGKKEPLMITQILADMRTNTQVSPYPEKTIPADIKDMADCGINYFATAAMPWAFEKTQSNNYPGYNEAFNSFSDSLKYSLDIIRQMGLFVEGMMTYPINRNNFTGIASFINNKAYPITDTGDSRFSTTDPKLPDINASIANYFFKRWGDAYYQYPNGRVPFCTEDTRGWLRIDSNIRYMDGPQAAASFAIWAKAKYGSLDAINKAWETDFKTMSEINPEKYGQVSVFSGRLEYLDPKQPFVDYNQAMTDWDVFRSEIRSKNYKDILTLIDKSVPNPGIAIRTEGANWLVSGIPSDTKNDHYRHIYYNQRRQGMIAEIVQRDASVISHSDYTTLPYTPSEVRELTKMSVQQGIIPMHLPCFEKMRDIAINTLFGEPYKTHYNLDTSAKGIAINVLQAAFPWFQATYEEGGVPGIMWEDLQCDAFVTETQRKELKFFKEKMQEALNTPEGKAWQAKTDMPKQDWRNSSLKMYSVDPEFVKNQISK